MMKCSFSTTVALYAITASYFAGVMVRLMLTLTPVVCVLSAIAFSECFSFSLQDEDDDKKSNAVRNRFLNSSDGLLNDSENSEPENNGNTANERVAHKNLYDKAGKIRKVKSDRDKDGAGIGSNMKTLISVLLVMMLMLFVVHCTWVTSNAYSSPSIVLASYSNDGSRVILDDFREAYFWLSQNTEDKSRVMSWWDYGYQIAGMANRTTLVDNNTWNNSHIALVCFNQLILYD